MSYLVCLMAPDGAGEQFPGGERERPVAEDLEGVFARRRDVPFHQCRPRPGVVDLGHGILGAGRVLGLGRGGKAAPPMRFFRQRPPHLPDLVVARAADAGGAV